MLTGIAGRGTMSQTAAPLATTSGASGRRRLDLLGFAILAAAAVPREPLGHSDIYIDI